MKNIALTLISICSAGFLFSQTHSHEHGDNHERYGHWCGKNHFTEKVYQEHPEYRAMDEADAAAFEEMVRTRDRSQQKGDDEVYIIPVVFHVVHAGGSENISDAQIHSAIEVMNEDFSASNPDLGQTIPEFEDIIANVGIEFRLAKLDPDGNCTNGINRVYLADTYNADEEDVKDGDATIWDRNSYLNIWTVGSIEGGTVAFSRFPANWNTEWDGIMTEHTAVGRTGTADSELIHTLSHEVGHYLRLEHVWGNSNTPGVSCGSDGVSDTPTTRGRQWSGQNCDLYDETCGSLDNVQNQMDYSFCSTMFTEGQKTRMLNALNSTTGGRRYLWSDDNLAETGVLDPDVICRVEFITDEEPILCPGQEIEFTDASFNGATNWEWTFEGGNPASSDDNVVEVTWDEPGTYDVTLTVSNANGSMTGTFEDYITILPEGENALPFSESFESFASLEDNSENWFVLDEHDTDEKWELKTDVGYTGNKSIWVNGRLNTDDAVEIISSPTYDLSGLSENAILTFKYAHAKRQGNSDDKLRVMISKNCGATWSVRETLDIDELPTVSGNVSGNFVPSSQDDWAEVEIDNIVSVFLNEQFRIRFEYTSYRGNNLYIDDINIIDATTVGLDGVTFVNRLDIYPNPTADNTWLSYTLEQPSTVKVDVLDLSGRIVSQAFEGQASGDQRIALDTKQLQSGVYLVRIESGGEQIVRKLVKQ